MPVTVGEKKFYTIEDFASAAGVSYASAARLIRTGVIRTEKLQAVPANRSRKVIAEADWNAFMESTLMARKDGPLTPAALGLKVPAGSK